jgi:hypothetical protein
VFPEVEMIYSGGRVAVRVPAVVAISENGGILIMIVDLLNISTSQVTFFEMIPVNDRMTCNFGRS